MKVPVFWTPLSVINVDGTEKMFPPLPNAKYEFHYPRSAGLMYEVDEVRKCIRAGKKESEFVTHNDSLIIARIQDEIRKQLGVIYDNE